MKIVCELAPSNNSSWFSLMQIVQGYFHLVSKVRMNQQFNSIHIYRGWRISKRSAEKSHQQTMFSRLESKETKGRGEREGDNRKRSSARRSVPRREQLQREIFNFCVELIEKALLAPLALLEGTNLDILSEWSGRRWKKAWGHANKLSSSTPQHLSRGWMSKRLQYEKWIWMHHAILNKNHDAIPIVLLRDEINASTKTNTL